MSWTPPAQLSCQLFTHPVCHPWTRHDPPAWSIGQLKIIHIGICIASFCMYNKLENLYPSNGVWRVPGICRAWGVVFWFPPLPLSPITPSLSTADIGGQGASLKFPSKAGGRGYLSPVPSPQDADGPLGGGVRAHHPNIRHPKRKNHDKQVAKMDSAPQK